MAKDQDRDQDAEANKDAIAKLVRPSTLPPPKMDDDGMLDLRALAKSVPPPAAVPAEAKELSGNGAQADAARASTPSPEKKAAAPAQPAAAPVAARVAEPTPVAAPKSGGSGMFVGILIGAAVAAGGVYVATNQGREEPLAAAPSETAPRSASVDRAPEPVGAPTPAPVEPAPVEPAPAEAAPVEPAPVEPSPAEAAPPAPETAPSEPASRGSRRERGNQAGATASPTTAAETPEPTAMAEPASEPAPTMASTMAEEPAPATMNSVLDSVLDNALGGRPREGGTRTTPGPAPAPATAPAGDLPSQPDQGTVRRVLAGLMPAIRQCAGDQVGMATAAIVVRNDGSVGSVSIAGPPFGGTPQGSCMEGAIQRAQFPRFSQTTFNIRYPFMITARP